MSNVFGQINYSSYKFSNLNIKNGLSSNTVNAVIQDQKGFLWIGTEEGLCRFDGLSFRIYKHSTNNKNSLAQNYIWDLREDKDGKNWVEEFVHPDCVGWSMVAPMPRTKAVTNRWLNAYKPYDKIIEYQVDPLSIVIKNNMAIVHYYYLMLTVNKDSKPEKEKGRWTEIWIKEGNKWLCLGWQGGPDKSED